MFGWVAGVAVFWVLGIVLWIMGSSKRNAAMTIIGGFFTLFIIGLIIALVQVNSWNNTQVHHHVHHGSSQDHNVIEKLKKEIHDLKNKKDK